MVTGEATEPRTLPATSYAILGLLTFGEMSGYDLMKLAAQSVAYFWTPAKSQIYGELKRLVEAGFATAREVAQHQRPDKRLFRITPEGERALRDWLRTPTDEPETIKAPGLLKLFFGHLVEPETMLEQLRVARARHEQLLARFEEIERQIRDKPEMLFPYLTLRNGLAHVRATLAWHDEAARELEKVIPRGQRNHEEGE